MKKAEHWQDAGIANPDNDDDITVFSSVSTAGLFT
jgi:hypothetical protein